MQIIQKIQCSGTIRSRKVRSLLELEAEGLPVIETFQIDAANWSPKCLREAPPWIAEGPLYVRICFDAVEYPHSFYQICTWQQLTGVIPEMMAKAAKITRCPCDITIQPHLHERLGGALAAIGPSVLIESVYGNARGLLRDGQLNYRVFVDPTGLREEFTGRQESALVWRNGDYQRLHAKRIVWEDVSALSMFSFEPIHLYEYCILLDGRPLILEKKLLPQGSFSLLPEKRAFCVWPPDVSVRETVHYALPNLELAPQLHKEKLHIFAGGGYLSHLSFYAAEKKLPMIVREESR